MFTGDLSSISLLIFLVFHCPEATESEVSNAVDGIQMRPLLISTSSSMFCLFRLRSSSCI